MPIAVPSDAMLAEIAQKPASAQELEGPSARVRGKPKKPNNALTDDARKMLKHALHGNENVHFYDPRLDALRGVQRKVELDQKRQEMMK